MKHIKNKYFDYYKDDNELKQGIFKYYYSNGSLYNICNYINGKEHGEDKFYNKDGSHNRSDYYNHGKNITEFII